MKAKDVQIILERWGYRCAYCQQPLSRDTYQMEHFIPKCAGGENGSNIVVSCLDCNTRKGKRLFGSVAECRIALGFCAYQIAPSAPFKAKWWAHNKTAKGDVKAQRERWRARHRHSYNDYMKRYMAARRNGDASL